MAGCCSSREITLLCEIPNFTGISINRLQDRTKAPLWLSHLGEKFMQWDCGCLTTKPIHFMPVKSVHQGLDGIRIKLISVQFHTVIRYKLILLSTFTFHNSLNKSVKTISWSKFVGAL